MTTSSWKERPKKLLGKEKKIKQKKKVTKDIFGGKIRIIKKQKKRKEFFQKKQ